MLIRMNTLSDLENLHRAGQISDLAWHFTQLLSRKTQEQRPEILLASCLVSQWTAAGNICVPLARVAGQAVFTTDATAEGITAPALPQWRSALCHSPLVGQPGDHQPLILDHHDRLYLYRYWHYEHRLAQQLRTLAAAPAPAIDSARLRADLQHYFGPPGAQPNGQKIAAATVVLRRFCVISGGPGTGKTSTVLKVLALLLKHSPPPVIALAAPTGKAAARMHAAITQALRTLDVAPELHAALPSRAQTLHRLLGPLPDGVNFRHHRANPLPLDVLIVDEASMIDLALMSKLVDALPSSARLVLLGDKDQLASVEAGAVLGDICTSTQGISAAFHARLSEVTAEPLPAPRAKATPLHDSVVSLSHSYRFGADSGIGRLARAINDGKPQSVMTLLTHKRHADIRWRDLSGPAVVTKLALRLAEGFAPYLRLLAAGADAEAIVAAFERFRVLCALRHGPFGVSGLNRAIERELQRRQLIPTRLYPSDGLWYRGRPVLITRNHDALQLYNGDIGLALPDADGQLRVAFPSASGALRYVLPSRLPEHDTVFAMTIHKSQGSEFDQVLVILPPDDTPILGRELLYTAITRARQEVELWATPQSVRAAVGRRVERASGLHEQLRVGSYSRLP